MTNEAIPYQEFGANRLRIALCIVLPMAFHAIGAGATFLPMHIPVLLCGLLCGLAIWSGLRLDWPAAFLPADGNAACLPNPASHDAGTMRIWRVDRAVLPKAEGKPLSLRLARCWGGCAVSGIANAVLLGIAGKPYGFTVFLTSAFVTALPGIVIQLVAVPLLVAALQKAGLVQRPRRVCMAEDA